MPDIIATEQDGNIILSFEGDMLVENAAEMKEILLQKHNENKGKTFVLDMSGVGKADLSFIQIIAALCKTRIKDDSLKIAEEGVSEAVAKVIRLSGYGITNNCHVAPWKECVITESLNETLH